MRCERLRRAKARRAIASVAIQRGDSVRVRAELTPLLANPALTDADIAGDVAGVLAAFGGVSDVVAWAHRGSAERLLLVADALHASGLWLGNGPDPCRDVF
jgi:hypothetical protein